MSGLTRRILFWSVPALALAIALYFAFSPSPVEVDLYTVKRTPLVESVSEEGETRIRDVFVLSSPIRGRALRIEIEEGDSVTANETVVAEIEPISPDFLDFRTEAEAEATIEMARAAVEFAKAERERARAEMNFAHAELERAKKLRQSDTVSASALDNAERLYFSRRAAHSSALAAVRMRESELAAAQVRVLQPLTPPGSGLDCPCMPVIAPVTGKVLRVIRESEGVVDAGQPLVEIGNPSDLEIVVDFLSTDAVKIEPAQRALIEEWGKDDPLNAIVKKVEPFGFTKVSALGIEEQRVNVILQLTDPPSNWARLGHGYQVEARIVLWEDEQVLNIPLTALFRDGDNWVVFKSVNGSAVQQTVTIGHKNEFSAEITDGLNENDVVVRYPNDHIVAGTLLVQR